MIHIHSEHRDCYTYLALLEQQSMPSRELVSRYQSYFHLPSLGDKSIISRRTNNNKDEMSLKVNIDTKTVTK